MADATAQFVAITGAATDKADFYLESAGGDVEAAISSYFETSGAGAGPGDAQDEVVEPADDPEFLPDAPDALAGGGAGGAADPGAGAGSSSGAGSGRPKRAAAQQGGVRSLGDLRDEEEDSDDEQGNELFTGGAKSGQVVRGPKKNQDNKADDVEGLFDRARQAGAVDGTREDLRPGGAGGGGAGSSFTGAARTLAGDAPAAPAEEAGPLAPAPAQPQPLVHTITFYANGVFTVDDGEPRDMRDPANAPFMNSIARGECPRELEPADGSVPVNVNLVRNGNDYVEPPKPAYTAFSGQGRTLAGPEPAAEPAPAASPAAAEAPSPGAASAATAWPGPDESQPVTSIQLRLADGSRMVARFNLSQTVGDLRSFIAASRPDLARAAYRLATAFPAAELADDGATIQGAGLQNAVVVQKPA